MVFLSKRNGYSVSMPLAKDEQTAGNLKTTIHILEAYFESLGQPFHMHLVTKDKFELLEQLFPGKYSIEFDRDVADYVYEVDKMASLTGRKLHGKRNHIRKFKARLVIQNSACFSPFSPHRLMRFHSSAI